MENDGGLLFRGVYNRIKPVPWSYAQYDKDVLDCAFFVIAEVEKVSISEVEHIKFVKGK